jgi:hypothetical protein
MGGTGLERRSQQRSGFVSDTLVELNGALSNPLERDKDLLARLTATRATLLRETEALSEHEPRVLPARAHPVRAAVEGIVSRSTEPRRVRDVCAALVELGFEPLHPDSVRKTLHDGSRSAKPRFRRVGWGLYENAVTEADST